MAAYQGLRGLIIRKPYVDWILDGLKTWEIRGSATKTRGPIALIEGGSGTVVGTCELRDVIGPLTSKEFVANAGKLNRKPSRPLRRTFFRRAVLKP